MKIGVFPRIVFPRVLFGLILLALLGGCATNPVTGEQELAFVSRDSEIAIGEKNYQPAQQSQGGKYVLDPELTRYVNEVGQRLGKVSDRPDLPFEFVVLNNSVPNAWAMPGGKIAVNRGLLTELHSEAELAAVLGHEIVHATARHGANGIERGVLLQAAVLGVGLAASNSDYRPVAVGAAALAASLVTQKYSRGQESEADYYGMKYMAKAGYDPQAAVELQKTFVRLSKGHASGWVDGLFASHPPSEERVAANERTAEQLGAGGEIGKQRYLQHIARLLRDKPAYAAYDEGRKALKKGDARKALKLAEKAIAIEPKEAVFYGLRGDAHKRLGAKEKALKDYDRAVSLNGEYYALLQGRGELEKSMGLVDRAEQDLQKAHRLLPTAGNSNASGDGGGRP